MVDYRLINGDGEYIDEFVPDTKALYGENKYISGVNIYSTFIDKKTGKLQLEIMLESYKTSLPQLQDATLEIESINFFNEKGFVKAVDGKWIFNIAEANKGKKKIDYVMEAGESSIELLQATASTTALQVTFALEGVYEDENTFANQMFIQDELGNKYESANGFKMEIENGKTIISTTFPITAEDDFTTLLLTINSLDELALRKK